MISFKQISVEKMEEIIGDYERVSNEVMEKYGKQLIDYYN